MKWLFVVILFIGFLSGCATVQHDVSSELNDFRERIVNLERTDKEFKKIIGAIIMELSKPHRSSDVQTTY